MDPQRYLVSHPGRTWNALIFPFGVAALSATPSFLALVILLTGLILYTMAAINRNNASVHLVCVVGNLAVATTIANMSASATALPNSFTSLATAFIRGFISSGIALLPLRLNATLYRRQIGPLSRLVLFPTVWATCWASIAQINPVGRLGGWTPILGEEGYRWLRPITGMMGIDFVTAAWALVAAEVIGEWIMRDSDHTNRTALDHDVLEEDTSTRRISDRRWSLIIFAGILYALTFPSIGSPSSNMPLPVYSPDTTTIAASCVLPANSTHTALDRYIAETKALGSRARLHLWPEGAVSFDSPAATLKAEGLVQDVSKTYKVWVGMAFDEAIPSSNEGHRSSLRRNGLSLISPSGEIFRYFKRNLVPIAESYSHTPGTQPPPIGVIPLPRPNQSPKYEWKTYPRNISVTTSICLDFSKPLPKLPIHPTLILAPARTWHRSIGLAMALLADARAEEVGAAVLWCDGGEGAIGGVFGAGRGLGLDVEQVGSGGSWISSFAVPFTDSDTASRTIYGAVGDLGVFIFFTIVLGSCYLGDTFASRRSAIRSTAETSGSTDAEVGNGLDGHNGHGERPMLTDREPQRRSGVANLIDIS